ncbi:hypothetical protein ACP4OV_002409 [Aristida adscensionis]
MAAPTSFSNPLAKWIYNRCTESLLFVMVEPKGKSEIESIKNIAKKLNILTPEEAVERSNESRSCTGFVVEEKEGVIKILTIAHCIDHVFTSSKPISAQKVQRLFRISIICDHYETAFCNSKRRDKIRYYNAVRVAEIDCGKDLLLLQVDRENILGFDGKTCQHSHRPLLPSRNPPTAFEIVAMISWPPRRVRTSAIGEISHCSRAYDDASDKNPNGYDMTLLEVNIPGHDGSSGAPLLDGSGDYSGLLHAGGKDCFSCFVSLHDILQCLTRWGIEYLIDGTVRCMIGVSREWTMVYSQQRQERLEVKLGILIGGSIHRSTPKDLDLP